LTRGAIIQGRRQKYRIDRALASGGLGRIWSAIADGGARVTIKEAVTVGRPDVDKLNLERLRVEAVILEKLTGPRPMLLSLDGYNLDPNVRRHFIRFLDVDSLGVMPHALVLEYVEGKTLEELRGGSLYDNSKILEYAKTMLEIVKSLHQNNIQHRGISPQSFVITSEEARNPILTDFGTAKEGYNQLSYPGKSQLLTGIRGYSAPETWFSMSASSCDVYSVAATILFMFTGVNPQYLIDATGELRDERLNEIPAISCETLKTALSPDPAKRYQTTDDLLNALLGRLPTNLSPYIVADDRKITIKESVIIGRAHMHPSRDCEVQGYSDLPLVSLNDPERFVSRHHARLTLKPSGECFIEALKTASSTAIGHISTRAFEVIQPRREYGLNDGDLIALAYSPIKGPYVTLTYHQG
jgi:serine/threonine protein kinase